MPEQQVAEQNCIDEFSGIRDFKLLTFPHQVVGYVSVERNSHG